MKPQANYSAFESLDIRVGKVINVEDSQTKKPTYRITIDFGAEVGTKVSCGAYRNYKKEDLIGKQIIGVINFEAKNMGPEVSQVLMLGVANEKGETIYLTPQADVNPGGNIF